MGSKVHSASYKRRDDAEINLPEILDMDGGDAHEMNTLVDVGEDSQPTASRLNELFGELIQEARRVMSEGSIEERGRLSARYRERGQIQFADSESVAPTPNRRPSDGLNLLCTGGNNRSAWTSVIVALNEVASTYTYDNSLATITSGDSILHGRTQDTKPHSITKLSP